VATLLAAGVTVVVISPNQLKNLRSRCGQVGNKDDRFDAFVLADTLRTDRLRLRTLTPDSPATVALRAAVRARKDLVHHRVALCNQLRAHLKAFHPAPVGLFHELDGLMSLKFLARFDCQDRVDWADSETTRRIHGRYPLLRRHHTRGDARPHRRRPSRGDRRRGRGGGTRDSR
jgi:transposase